MSNVRKKLLFSKNTQNQVNKKVATGEAGVEKKEEQVSSEITSNDVAAKTKQLKSDENKKENKEVKEEKVLPEKTIELEEQLKTLQKEYESKQSENIEEIKNTNIELDKKREDANKASKKNQKLITKLKNIEKEIGEKYKKAVNITSIKKLKNKNEQNIQKDIKVKEKQIEKMQKVVDAEKAQQIKYENLLNDDEIIQKAHNLQKELNTIDEKINEIKDELGELYIYRSRHLSCTREINELKMTLNVMKNEMEFESKKKNMIMSTTIKNTRNKKILNEGLTISNDLLNTPNSKLAYSKKIRYEFFKQKRPPKPKKVAKSTFKYILTEFDLIENSKKNPRKNSSKNILNKPNSIIDNEYVPEPNLFTERETKILKTVLPESYIAKYMEKYDEKKVEKDEIENKFGEFDEKKNDNMKIKYQIDALKLNIKAKGIIESGLLAKYRKNNRLIYNLKQEITEYKKKIQEQERILIRMEKYTEFYSNTIKSMKKKKELAK